jgi:hypothetical protein
LVQEFEWDGLVGGVEDLAAGGPDAAAAHDGVSGVVVGVGWHLGNRRIMG